MDKKIIILSVFGCVCLFFFYHLAQKKYGIHTMRVLAALKDIMVIAAPLRKPMISPSQIQKNSLL